jgi:uncharacterized membrane protein
MRRQEASTTVRAPLDEVESFLADVEQWPSFLVGVDSVVRQSGETFVFELHDGSEHRQTTVEVKHQPILHRIVWQSLEGPSFTGTWQLAALDAEHTRVRLQLAQHPASFMAALSEMLLPGTDRAAYDLARLSELLPQRR